MNHPRRKFLKSATQLGFGLALTSAGLNLAGCHSAKKTSGATNTANTGTGNGMTNSRPFGIQLYTLRDDMAKDPKDTLKQVASFGYKQIESFEGGQGIFWGMSAADFKKYLDDLGMQIISSHCDINKDFEQKAADAASIGMKYLIEPYLGKQPTLDDYKRAADTFNARGEVCRKAGLRFAYHNHDYSFTQQDGQFPQDVMMQNTDPNLVDYEMDMYWVRTAGQDPQTWFQKYPNRFRLGHVKDRRKDAQPGEHEAFTILGTGGIDYATLLPQAVAAGMQYFFIEQDQTPGTTPLNAAKQDAAALAALKF